MARALGFIQRSVTVGTVCQIDVAFAVDIASNQLLGSWVIDDN